MYIIIAYILSDFRPIVDFFCNLKKIVKKIILKNWISKSIFQNKIIVWQATRDTEREKVLRYLTREMLNSALW
jgi:hypothetical protein